MLRVRDTGAGIAPDVLQHLFEPFFQAPQTLDRARGGLGLGLAMVKGLVELHQGTVKVASDGPGRGTEVTVVLPRMTAPAKDAPALAPGSAPAPIRQRRVLVIEDNVDSADSLRDALALNGHDVRVAYDGPRGLAMAREFRPEVVLCDIGLPGMDGYEVARLFRADPTLDRAQLIALSGYAQSEDIERAGSAGFDRHLAKPPDLDRLNRLLAEAPNLAIDRRASETDGAQPSQ